MYTQGKKDEVVRVLIVDDDEDDYVITRDLLSDIQAARYEVEWISDGEEAIRRLSDPRAGSLYDVCLLDYRLGRYNGLDVLREVIANGSSTPVILLTGQEDSDVDREAVRIGASDYLVKGRINAILIERAIRYACQQKQTLEALRSQTDFVSAILDTAGALVVVLDRDGRIVRFNRQCELTTGYTLADVQGRTVFDFLLLPDDEEAVRDVFGKLKAGEGASHYENDWVIRDGERRRISWSNTTLPGRDGTVEFVVCTGIDVTDRRLAQKDLAAAREREVEVGASIQRTLLVRKPPQNLPGITFGATSVPSQKIGGDYFDFFVFGETCVDVLVGDVMGKGISAALLAAAAKTQFQRAVRRLVYGVAPYGRLPEPEEIVAAVHAVLTPELVRLNSFLTLAYARFDLVRREMKFVDCGHPHPLHVRKQTGCCELLSGDNMPLGMNAGERYRQVTLPFLPGDVFFFYSDGLTEACDNSDELYGEERLIETVCAAAQTGTPQAVTHNAVNDVQSFCNAGESVSSDDLTCVAVRIEDWLPLERLGYRVMEMRSDADKMESARDFIDEFCVAFARPSISEGEQDLLILAINEAVGNSIEHAYGGSADGRIQVEAESYSDHLRFRVYDDGMRFREHANVPPPSFDGSRDSGFGRFIMEQCFDRVEYSNDDIGRNCVTLTKLYRGDTA